MPALARDGEVVAHMPFFANGPGPQNSVNDWIVWFYNLGVT